MGFRVIGYAKPFLFILAKQHLYDERSIYKDYVCGADHATPHYLQKLALKSSTNNGHSTRIVRSQTKATKLFSYVDHHKVSEG
jgi:hypothetical protein